MATRAALVTLTLVSTGASASLVDGYVSDDVAGQVTMIEKFVAKFQQSQHAIGETEKTMLQAVDQIFTSTTLPGIASGHQSDLDLLAQRRTSILECDKEGTNVQTALDSITSKIDQCRAKEKELEDAAAADLKTLTDFRVALAADEVHEGLSSLLQVQASTPGCETPDPSDIDAAGSFFERTFSWYQENGQKLKDLMAASDKATSEHQKHKGVCEAMQEDFEKKFCLWHASVSSTHQRYTACRTRTEADLNDAWAIVQENMKHRKADFTAVKHVQCLLGVLLGDDEDKADGLNSCIKMAVNTDHLIILKPDVPPSTEQDIQSMISDITNRHGDLKDEENALDKAKELCQRMGIDEINEEHSKDVQAVADLEGNMQACNSALDNAAVVVNTLHESMLKELNDHNRCQGELSAATERFNNASAAIKAFLAGPGQVPGRLCDMPSDRSAIGGFLESNHQFYSSSDEAIEPLAAEFKTAHAAMTSKTAECAQEEAEYKKSQCDWAADVAKARTAYAECRAVSIPAANVAYIKIKDREATPSCASRSSKL